MEKNILEQKRHTLAHLLCAVILEKYPDAKPTIGPAIDNGFYYDFDFPTTKPNEKDLKDLEKAMRKRLNKWTKSEHREISYEELKEIYKNNPFKLELIEEFKAKGEKLTIQIFGENDRDLCRGGHIQNPSKEIDGESFILSRVAGAYWRGSEKNKQLTRIYGLAFDTKKELDDYTKMLEEAKKRDHKILGRELDIFTFSDLVGSGLPLWTPKGTVIRNLLDQFVWELRNKHSKYDKVEIPHITKKELYETSGHWAKFKDELFKITTREGHEFAMKPMNCPHHTQIYARKLWSYRELPQRYANTTTCYRDEQTGELSGLSRVRAFSQDDAHVFCRKSDIEKEFSAIWNIVMDFYSSFGFVLKVRLSLHDPAKQEKYLGDESTWQMAETILRNIVTEKNVEWYEGVGEAAFYGPKLDFMAKDALGREWQVATIQLDVNMPERFDLYCMNEKGEHERIVMIHAAIMGSIERFMSILIEHTAGRFPLWLAPVQVKVIPVSEAQNAESQKIEQTLKSQGIRAELDLGNEGFGKKVRNAKTALIPYFIILGEKDLNAGVVTLESRDRDQLGQMTIEKVVERLVDEISNRKQ
jgi:threonyl-tRNA synthetase